MGIVLLPTFPVLFFMDELCFAFSLINNAEKVSESNFRTNGGFGTGKEGDSFMQYRSKLALIGKKFLNFVIAVKEITFQEIHSNYIVYVRQK